MERVSPAPETHTEALLSSPEPHPLSAAYRPSGTVWFLLDILVVVVCVVVRELAFVLWVADMHSVWRDIHEGSPVWAPPVGLQFANVSYDISTQSLWQRLRNFWTRFGSLRNRFRATNVLETAALVDVCRLCNVSQCERVIGSGGSPQNLAQCAWYAETG
jgi:hypothetical protein